ncbi:MAG: hypothetical protein J6A22_08085 [Bacteroidales bacterium]|nr:hypothetical protein [Bacteroidales bacterium]
MKKILLAAMAVCTQLACVEVGELQNPVKHGQKEEVKLTVSLPVVKTKVTGASDEERISNVQVLVFNAETDLVESYLSVDSPDLDSPIELTCTTGEKDIKVMVNSKFSYSSVLTPDDPLLKRAELLHNTKEKHFMYGEKTVNLTASQSVTVEVQRQIAKVVLKKIEVNFESEALAENDLIINAIYMLNVCNRISIPYESSSFDATYYSDPMLWYNKMMAQYDMYNDYLYDTLTGVALDKETIYDTEHFFYVFPNMADDSYSEEWCPRFTRLVVETTYKDKTYYYPVSIPYIKSNTVYTVSMKITRLGSSSPDIPVQKTSGGFTIDVKDWDYATEINEVI